MAKKKNTKKKNTKGLTYSLPKKQISKSLSRLSNRGLPNRGLPRVKTLNNRMRNMRNMRNMGKPKQIILNSKHKGRKIMKPKIKNKSGKIRSGAGFRGGVVYTPSQIGRDVYGPDPINTGNRYLPLVEPDEKKSSVNFGTIGAGLAIGGIGIYAISRALACSHGDCNFDGFDDYHQQHVYDICGDGHSDPSLCHGIDPGNSYDDYTEEDYDHLNHNTERLEQQQFEGRLDERLDAFQSSQEQQMRALEGEVASQNTQATPHHTQATPHHTQATPHHHTPPDLDPTPPGTGEQAEDDPPVDPLQIGDKMDEKCHGFDVYYLGEGRYATGYETGDGHIVPLQIVDHVTAMDPPWNLTTEQCSPADLLPGGPCYLQQ